MLTENTLKMEEIQQTSQTSHLTFFVRNLMLKKHHLHKPILIWVGASLIKSGM
jgi:hypothetical protein